MINFLWMMVAFLGGCIFWLVFWMFHSFAETEKENNERVLQINKTWRGILNKTKDEYESEIQIIRLKNVNF